MGADGIIRHVGFRAGRLFKPGRGLEGLDAAREFIGKVGMVLAQFGGGYVAPFFPEFIPFEQIVGNQFLIAFRHGSVPHAA